MAVFNSYVKSPEGINPIRLKIPKPPLYGLKIEMWRFPTVPWFLSSAVEYLGEGILEQLPSGKRDHKS